MQFERLTGNIKTMIIMSIKFEALQLLALILLVGIVDCYPMIDETQRTSFANSNQQAYSEYPAPSQVSLELNDDLSDRLQQERKRQQQERVERAIDIPLRYVFAGSMIFKDLDQDGHASRVAQQRRIRLDHLLESLSYSMLPTTTASPIVYRSGRTYRNQLRQSALDQASREMQQQQEPKVVYPIDLVSLGVALPISRDQAGSIETLSPPARSLAAESRSYINNNKSYRYSGNRRPFNKEEVLIHSPMHPRAATDYEFKRVENSRWNNLKGMWGKRAAPEADQASSSKQIPSSAVSEASFAENLDNKSAEMDGNERQLIKSM